MLHVELTKEKEFYDESFNCYITSYLNMCAVWKCIYIFSTCLHSLVRYLLLDTIMSPNPSMPGASRVLKHSKRKKTHNHLIIF